MMQILPHLLKESIQKSKRQKSPDKSATQQPEERDCNYGTRKNN